MIEKITNDLNEFSVLIHSIDNAHYNQKLNVLSGSSIGEHTRHVIECYRELIKGLSSGQVCYDNRERNVLLQTDNISAKNALKEVISGINQSDIPLMIQVKHFDSIENMESSYYRELLYNYEHMIHHQALIKIGLKSLCIDQNITENFGVAPSTISYRNNVYR